MTARAPRLAIDPAGPPAYAQIEERLAETIGRGGLAPGERLPPERALAALLGVSRMTLRHALGSLERRGLVSRSVGRGGGTFVSRPKLERDLTSFSGLSEQLRRNGMRAGSRLLAAVEKPATGAVASALGLEPGEPVYEVARVRLGNGEPLALERSCFPADRLAGLLECPLEGSLYDLLAERFGARPARAVERLEPVLADAAEARELGVRPAAPLMLVERIAYAEDGTPLEFAHDLFRGDRTRVVVWTSEVGDA